MFELSKIIQAPKCDFNYRDNELLYDFSFSDLVSGMYGRGMYIMDLGMLNVQTDICIAYSDKSCWIYKHTSNTLAWVGKSKNKISKPEMTLLPSDTRIPLR